jgi:protein tyrosine phosphatase (PTP) superfamily phosphohydrolase (DUF442 family)
VVRLSERLYSAGLPSGEEGFRSVQRLGIRTLISVDGAPPDVALARRFGIRYVHLPIGYDGCPQPMADRIVKAVRDLPGPVLIHCHHGKHRSPTAAALARIALDGISSEQAVREMERAGTGKAYTGLYADVRRYRPPTSARLDAMPADFPETTPTPPLVTAMVQIERRFDRLVQLQKSGWKDAAAVDAAQEALQLRELYTELNRRPDQRGRPADYRTWMRRGQQDSSALETALRARTWDAASMALGRLAAGCGACHAAHRNVTRRR